MDRIGDQYAALQDLVFKKKIKSLFRASWENCAGPRGGRAPELPGPASLRHPTLLPVSSAVGPGRPVSVLRFLLSLLC